MLKAVSPCARLLVVMCPQAVAHGHQFPHPEWTGVSDGQNDVGLLQLQHVPASPSLEVALALGGTVEPKGEGLETVRYTNQGFEQLQDLAVIPSRDCNSSRAELVAETEQSEDLQEDVICAVVLNDTSGGFEVGMEIDPLVFQSCKCSTGASLTLHTAIVLAWACHIDQCG